jgi:hypothetical protein
VGNTWKYAIKGNFVLSSTSHETVAGQAQAQNCPGVLTRTSPNKLITATHENIHGEAGTDVINNFNLAIHSSVYADAMDCAAAANSYVAGLTGALSTEMTNQNSNHPDHTNEPIQAVYCDANNQTVETTNGYYP